MAGSRQQAPGLPGRLSARQGIAHARREAKLPTGTGSRREVGTTYVQGASADDLSLPQQLHHPLHAFVEGQRRGLQDEIR